MAMTFKEMLEHRNRLLERKAVYEHMVLHLEEFIPGEGDEETDESIIGPNGGPVHSEVIQEFIDEFRTEGLEPLSEEIEKLEATEVPEETTDDEEEEDDDEEEEVSEEDGGAEGAAEEGGAGGEEDRQRSADSGSAGAGRGKAKAISLRK